MKEEKRLVYVWVWIILFNVIVYLIFALLRVADEVAVRYALFHPSTSTLWWLGAAVLCSIIEGAALALSSKSRNALLVTLGAVVLGVAMISSRTLEGGYDHPFFILGVFFILEIAFAYIGEVLVIYFVARQIQKRTLRVAQGVLVLGAISILVLTSMLLVNARTQSVGVNDTQSAPVTAHLVPTFDPATAQRLEWIKIENKYLGFSFFYYHVWKLDGGNIHIDGQASNKERGYDYISYYPALGPDRDVYGIWDAHFIGSRYICARNPDYAKASLVTLGSLEVRAKRLAEEGESEYETKEGIIEEKYFIDLPKGGCLTFVFSVDPKKDKDGVYLEFSRNVIATVQFE